MKWMVEAGGDFRLWPWLKGKTDKMGHKVSGNGTIERLEVLNGEMSVGVAHEYDWNDWMLRWRRLQRFF